MTCPNAILELVDRFARNREVYTSGRYNETQLRREFLDPFFIQLGWDVNNEKGRAETYKDVIHEDAIKIGGATKAPDYCFRIGGTRKFFLEAKKPSVNLKDDIPAAFQLRRYAWSAKLPLSILADFEEFAVYDCRVKPHKADKASSARTKYLRYDKYPDEWEWISGVFSKEAILQGSFDKYAASKKKRGTAEVDAAFLKEIENWREILAKNVALRNTLSSREINFAVQRTIDRIIFLRICEDRGIERQNMLQSLLNGEGVYGRMFEFFRRADERYNSGLFHFQKERGRATPPDDLTTGLEIDDKVLKSIIKNLYYPDSPYEFSVLPADILGQVYEQFLGKVIHLSSGGHRVKIEDKPEVKKAKGVYYTPTYIVDYIVKNTVGKLLEGKTPRQAQKLRILDPACGSGSFLIGAYQYLLDYHLRWYSEHDPKKHAKGRNPKLYQTIAPSPPGGEGRGERAWKLTTAERKRILLNNIYGVDIDTQAVEVTKLSLLLKVLEGESGQTLENQLKLYHERALPDLSSNIKCGNSLIGTDFYEGKQIGMFDEDEQYRINAFDWKDEFPEIFKGRNPGFDAVIGNPPYIGFHGFKDDKEYLRKSFQSAKGKFDYYLPFIEKGIEVLCADGLLGFICPTNFTKRGHGETLRKYLKRHVSIIEVCDFQDAQIFSGALNYTGVFVFQKGLSRNRHLIHYKKRSLEDSGFYVCQSRLPDQAWIFRDESTTKLVEKVKSQRVSLLSAITKGISEGIVTGQNKVFLLPVEKASKLGLETEILRKCLRGRQIRRYSLNKVTEVVIYPYELITGQTKTISEHDLSKFPMIWSYLVARKNDLAGRKYFEESSKAWYELWCQRNTQLLSCRKIVVPELSDSNRFALAEESLFYGDTACGITLLSDVPEKLLYLLGLLNSMLMQYYYQQTTVPKANHFFIYKTMYLKNLPIRRINFSDSADKSRHDRMVELVEVMLKLHRDLAAVKTEHDKAVIQRQIDATDKQIDKLVYELYGLTPDEIKMVEGG